jgi:hypothetical protein
VVLEVKGEVVLMILEMRIGFEMLVVYVTPFR